jgi:hypothetical protein
MLKWSLVKACLRRASQREREIFTLNSPSTSPTFLSSSLRTSKLSPRACIKQRRRRQTRQQRRLDPHRRCSSSMSPRIPSSLSHWMMDRPSLEIVASSRAEVVVAASRRLSARLNNHASNRSFYISLVDALQRSLCIPEGLDCCLL